MRRFYEIAFTPAVQAQQERRGSRDHYSKESALNVVLGTREEAFIADRDGFYLSTVGEKGWPYVQFRGGPPVFVRHHGGNKLHFADFRGNYQLISAGNATAESRCCLFFMDYAAQRRLKLFGILAFEDAVDSPELRERLGVAGYRAVLERVASVRVVAFDWNCGQHIPRRLTKMECRQQGDEP